MALNKIVTPKLRLFDCLKTILISSRSEYAHSNYRHIARQLSLHCLLQCYSSMQKEMSIQQLRAQKLVSSDTGSSKL